MVMMMLKAKPFRKMKLRSKKKGDKMKQLLFKTSCVIMVLLTSSLSIVSTYSHATTSEERVVPVRQVLVQVAVQLLHLEVQLLQVQV